MHAILGRGPQSHQPPQPPPTLRNKPNGMKGSSSGIEIPRLYLRKRTFFPFRLHATTQENSRSARARVARDLRKKPQKGLGYVQHFS